MHQVRLEPVVVQQFDQPPQPNAASNATGVPIGSSPTTFSTVSTPFGTFLLTSASPA
jgi:hypothetical protein